MKFHAQWYSSNIMGLAVIGRESLEDLADMVISLFSDVQNKTVAIPEWTKHPFGLTQLKKRYYVVPVKDIRNLNITFPIPDLQPHYRSSVSYFRIISITYLNYLIILIIS